MSRCGDELREKIERREAVLGVVGLGYVGLPLALAFAESGFGVLGFDLDRAKVETIARGGCYIQHVDSGRVARAVSSARLEASADLARLGEPDAILVCVPTPLTRHREPDLRFVRATSEAIASQLRCGQLVVLESTTYPGTTDEVVRAILDESGLECGADYFLAFSPEREDPGNPDYGTTAIPKVVGGVEPLSGDLAEALYGEVVERTVRVSSARAAEATKLLENIFRAVNIALVNELKCVFDAMGIDVWEVLDAAATKPFGFMRFNPGPGWGGHCIPIDPFYLAWKARESGQSTKFVELAGEVNVAMPRWVVAKLQLALNERGRAVNGARVLVLGLAYKRDVDDPRESPSFELLSRLRELGAEVSYHDPHIPRAPQMRSWPDLPEMESVPLTEEVLARADAVLVATDHSAVDYERVARHAALIVDARGVYRAQRPNVVRA